MIPTFLVIAARSSKEEVIKHKDFIQSNAFHQSYASSATKELDDLMASLSDFKVNLATNFLSCQI